MNLKHTKIKFWYQRIVLYKEYKGEFCRVHRAAAVTSLPLTVAVCVRSPPAVEPINGPLEHPEMQEK
jgi:hypothetical protein